MQNCIVVHVCTAVEFIGIFKTSSRNKDNLVIVGSYIYWLISIPDYLGNTEYM